MFVFVLVVLDCILNCLKNKNFSRQPSRQQLSAFDYWQSSFASVAIPPRS